MRAKRELRRVRIKSYEQLSLAGADAVALACRSYADLLERGLADHDPLLIHGSFKMLVALAGSEPVGVLVYDHQRLDHIWVLLGYVQETWRRRGVYTKLWRELVKLATKKNVRYIDGGTREGNLPMRAFNREVGRLVHHSTYRYELEVK